MAIVVKGIMRSAPFYQVKSMIEELAPNFNSIEIEELYEVDWILYKEKIC